MHTTIRLQHNFSFGLFPVFIFGILLLVPLIIYLINKSKSKSGNNVRVAEPVNQPVPNIPMDIKERYINSVMLLKRDYAENVISKRDGYQRLSLILREYISELTDIDITKKTLAEIRGLNLGPIENLIEEFYYFEFSTEQGGNLDSAINSTIEAIRGFR